MDGVRFDDSTYRGADYVDWLVVNCERQPIGLQ